MVDNCGQNNCQGQAGPFTVGGKPTTSTTPLLFDPGCPPIPANVVDISPWQLYQSGDGCIINAYINEALIIGGAPFHVYKLLGVHEQGKLVDVTGNGTPISNGDLPGFPSSNAFDIFQTEWRSIQKGPNVLAASYIGYDFGPIKTNNGARQMYSDEPQASVRKHITAIAIKQSPNEKNRATTARVERSDDGVDWFGVGIVQLPDDDCLNTIYLRDSVPQRFWRLRPVAFNGGPNDYWGIQAFEMFDNYTKTNIDNIQDKIFVENRDRAYSKDAILIKGSYDLLDTSTELSKFGVELPSQIMVVQFNFLAIVAALGRPLVIGDIVELPLEAQFSAELKRIQKWMEVTDVAWSTQGYTPGWHPTMLAVTMQPAMATQETQDIFGDLASIRDSSGLLTRDTGVVEVDEPENLVGGNDQVFQDYFDMSQTAVADSKSEVPEAGAEGSGTIRAWEQNEIDAAKAAGVDIKKTGLNITGLYVEDGMPPNNAPYTEGNVYPPNPKNGDYHRLTYTGLSKDVPTALYRYATSKGKWVFLEHDKRRFFNTTKPILQEFLKSSRPSPFNITK